MEIFRSRGVAVRCLVHTPSKEKALPQTGVDIHYGSINDRDALQAAICDVDTVVHLVATIRESRNSTFIATNYRGTENVVEAARETGVKHFIQLSTIGAADAPRYRYLHSKWLGEQAVINSGIPYTIIRPSLQFGEGDEFINSLAALVKAFPIVPVAGSGKNQFQPIAIMDTARCITDTVEREDLIGKTVEIGGPDTLTYNEIIDIVAKTRGLWRIRLPIPVGLMRPIVKLMEITLPRPIVTTEQLRTLPVPNITEPNSVHNTYGFEPRSLRNNIEYIKNISLFDALRAILGSMPTHMRPR